MSAIREDGSGKRYLGSAVYSVPESLGESGGGGSETLESVAWDEGRIGFMKSGSTYTLTDHWFVKDHLGNVRSVVDISSSLASPRVVERNDYLPYGTRMSVGSATLAANRYRLGGKEEQSFGGLDLGKVDFGARQYDPFTARWTTHDPMAEKYASMSPYSYCAGNPVNIVDPKGLDWYATQNANGEVEYHYDDNIKSSSDFNRLNISGRYLGKTYLASDKYYSLFGGIVQYKDNNGDLTFEGQLVKRIDELIIKNYSAQNSSDNNVFNLEIESEPSVDFFLNMPKGEYNFTYSGQFEQQPFHSVNQGSIYRSVDRANMRLKIQQMPPEKPRRLGGYGLGYNEPEWFGCFMLIGNNRYNTIQIQFDQNNAALFRKALNKQFSK